MRFIDAHLHTDMIEDAQLQKLVMMGMEAAVIPSPHMFLGSHDADTVLLLWERFLTMEANTATTLGYEAFSSLSVPFFGVNHADAENCLARLPDFLSHERVVAIGEIGLDCGTDFEVELFREHLRIAKAHDLPVILHTPIRLAPQGPPSRPRSLKIIAEEKFPVERCVFDHAGEETLDFRFATGGMVGLSICWDKMPPEAAARYVVDNPEQARPDHHQLRARRPGQRLLHGAARDAGHAPDGARQGDDRPGLLADAERLLQAAASRSGGGAVGRGLVNAFDISGRHAVVVGAGGHRQGDRPRPGRPRRPRRRRRPRWRRRRGGAPTRSAGAASTALGLAVEVTDEGSVRRLAGEVLAAFPGSTSW